MRVYPRLDFFVSPEGRLVHGSATCDSADHDAEPGARPRPNGFEHFRNPFELLTGHPRSYPCYSAVTQDEHLLPSGEQLQTPSFRQGARACARLFSCTNDRSHAQEETGMSFVDHTAGGAVGSGHQPPGDRFVDSTPKMLRQRLPRRALFRPQPMRCRP